MIRELELADLAALLALYTELHPVDEPLPEAERVRAIWQGLVESSDHLYLGAFVSDRLVSACNATVVANLTRGARPYALIENVVTHSDFRRQGHGRAAMSALIEMCWARGCYKIMLLSSLQRSEVYGFYAALGFNAQAKQAFVLSARRGQP